MKDNPQQPNQESQSESAAQQDQRVVPSSGSPHGFDKTEVDLEHGQLEPASRYHRPRGIHLYTFDKTETDLALGAKKINPSQPQ